MTEQERRAEEAAAAASTDHEEEQERPVIHDRRRIDPETGKLRQPEPSAEGSGPAPAAQAEEPAAAEGDALAKAQAEAAEAADQLARRNADLYNLQQEYNAFVRRSRSEASVSRQAGVAEVAEALLGVLDEIELARRHGDLTGPFQSIAEKLEQVLSQRFGLERFGQVGEQFDPAVHEALMHTTDADAEGVTVSQVLQPGYRLGERVLRAARVATTSAE